MLIDFHVPCYEEPGYGESLAETAKNLGIDRLCIAGGGASRGLAANARVLKQAESYPELLVPFARLDLAEDTACTVERLERVGFRGLQAACPPAPYDDERFFGIYEAAQALELPILFHTGFPARTPLDGAKRIRVANMRPVFLDTVARRFPDLAVVGVGLGWPWPQEAAEVMRWNTNVYYDLSGEILRRAGAEELGGLFRSEPGALWAQDGGGDLWKRVLFGSGARYEEIASAERDYQRVFRSLALTEQETAAVMGDTAARLLGIPLER